MSYGRRRYGKGPYGHGSNVSILELYSQVDAKAISVRVRAGGTEIVNSDDGSLAPALAISWSFAIGRSPSATLTIPGAPPAALTGFVAGQRPTLEIDVGFNGRVTRVFTGRVHSLTRTEDGTEVEAVGSSAILELAYARTVLTLDQVSASAAVTAILNVAGVTDYVVDLPDWTIGVLGPKTIEFSSYGEAVNEIAQTDAEPWYELPEGQVRVDIDDTLPAASPIRTYYAAVLDGVSESPPPGVTNPKVRPRLRSLKLDELLSEVRNRVTVIGELLECDEPFDNLDPMEVTTSAASAWIPTPPEFNDAIFVFPLIQTRAKLLSVSQHKTTVLNRFRTAASVQVEGDPLLRLGETVGVIDPTYSGASGNWFLSSYRCSLSAGQFQSDLTVIK